MEALSPYWVTIMCPLAGHKWRAVVVRGSSQCWTTSWVRLENSVETDDAHPETLNWLKHQIWGYFASCVMCKLNCWCNNMTKKKVIMLCLMVCTLLYGLRMIINYSYIENIEMRNCDRTFGNTLVTVGKKRMNVSFWRVLVNKILSFRDTKA